jgi:hypothetical protein
MMPRVIQPGGGGGKMRVRYTVRRKLGLVAASKRMQAEGMTLGELCVTTPPFQKRRRHAIPRPFQPKPRRPTFDCHVFRDCDWADRSI